MNNLHEKGAKGELIAAEYLQNKGYTIKLMNFSCIYGEIDIVAELNNYVVFVEVKWRYDGSFGQPSEAVTWKKRQHIIKAAMVYVAETSYGRKREEEEEGPAYRFDVVEILGSEENYKIRHIENAFDASLS